MTSITFIIPTIGRETLKRTVDSLMNQTISDWNAIIIFDGMKANCDFNDRRILVKEIDKLGLNANSAGLVRNYGMQFVETEWIAFVDDDDTLSIDYVETFMKEIESNGDIDVIIFRMRREDRIIPKLDTDNFYLCDVGISFAIKQQIYEDGYQFTPDGAEDFLYLDSIRKSNKYTIMISPFVKYYVRDTDDKSEELTIYGKRVFIGRKNNLFIFMNYLTYMLFKSKSSFV